jgi:hypothetical protein
LVYVTASFNRDCGEVDIGAYAMRNDRYTIYRHKPLVVCTERFEGGVWVKRRKERKCTVETRQPKGRVADV